MGLERKESSVSIEQLLCEYMSMSMSISMSRMIRHDVSIIE